MGNFLDHPETAKDTHLHTTSEGIDIGVTGMQGWRLEMEDKHVSVDIPSQPNHTFLAVFDGHGGSGAAIYAAKVIVDTLEAQALWKQYVADGARNIELLGEALTQTLVEVDIIMRAHQKTPGQDNSGCTAVTAIITRAHIICANAGDSRCVMGTCGRAKYLSQDHKPANKDERARIEAAGGCVQYDRVDGDLAVSRGLGDFDFKNRPDLPASEQKVSCYADITIHERCPADEVLILACDGLWDVMTNEEAVNQVYETFKTGETSMGMVAEEMVDVSLQKGSRDNISCIIAKLPGAVIGPAENGGVMGIRKKLFAIAEAEMDAEDAERRKQKEAKRALGQKP